MTARLRLSDRARLAELHGEAVVLHLASGRYFAANATGAALLRALSAPEGTTVEGLVDGLVTGHGADRARASADVAAWLARLREAGLLAGGARVSGEVARTLVAGARRVEVRGPADLVARTLGPLAALERRSDDAPAPAGPTVVLRVVAAVPDEVPPDARPRATRWVAGPPARIATDGVGTATFDADGGVTLRVRPDVPANDLAAERLAIPALAERLRREGVFLVHAACLRAPDGSGVWLVPAARGSGKTTLSLMLRRAGHGLLSDDRGFLVGPAAAPQIDPWPEAPRVGDRSLYLLPPDAMPGPRDPVMGKASVPALTPPRVPAPLPVRGFLLPRLVPGPGGPATPVRGAAALAPIASQVVVATDPTTAAATLAHLAAVLAARPCFAIPVGDDPAVAAAAIAALG